ncbi:S41 family peptidase [Spirosoma oryzicola]|uniref:S41 family peptidase n=1 Tax=Spirosoma oryzicola TaxID=2898794 RepID=UPI001E57DBEA|nr:S41 family peptidase [Spirosoma oryzicola]UHG94200.1 S41 family peptidase [Spirosoma oryzicola]
MTAPYLIVDLRDNQGGAEREARKYLTLLKKYEKKGHLYLLLNQDTISQAELFALQLKAGNNVTTIGQPTKGMLNYGSNYGTLQTLTGGTTCVQPTDMKNGAKLLAYEDYGISPDILLSNGSN